ncbi:MAG: HD domain-containing protein [Planctomycetota bacterium]
MLEKLPELRALHGGSESSSLIRIPNQVDVPVTPRVLRLIDTATFQRLSEVSQLGVVRFVYPAANHTRFEHSLGVYRNALLFLQHFSYDARFTESVSAKQAELLILAALLHDVGHWPFCHPIEDMRLSRIPSHESYASEYLHSDELKRLLNEDWQTTPAEVLSVIDRKPENQATQILASILSGPIDIDKMDYLYRDSLHAGVPYGQNFDAPRLIRSICLNQAGDRLAITRKGRTAAELMVFARYVMFSEVYWHHAVRSATAMFQRAFYHWHKRHLNHERFDDLTRQLFQSSENQMVQKMIASATEETGPEVALLDGLFGPTRRLYKRVANYGMDQNESIYTRIAQRPYDWLVRCSDVLAEKFSERLGINLLSNDVLIDAPPVGLEVQFDVDVFYGKENGYRKLGDVSPVVKTLAIRQFDDFVKQVRIFVAPSLKQSLVDSIGPGEIDRLLIECIETLDDQDQQ